MSRAGAIYEQVGDKMSGRLSLTTIWLAALSVTLVGACQHDRQSSRYILIRDFSKGNYDSLNSSLGLHVCIRGRVTVDRFHGGVYFPLQAYEDNGVITVDPSRIVSGLTYDYARGRGVSHRKIYTVCGLLRDATPCQKCDYNQCKWYRLEKAELQ